MQRTIHIKRYSISIEMKLRPAFTFTALIFFGWVLLTSSQLPEPVQVWATAVQRSGRQALGPYASSIYPYAIQLAKAVDTSAGRWGLSGVDLSGWIRTHSPGPRSTLPAPPLRPASVPAPSPSSPLAPPCVLHDQGAVSCNLDAVEQLNTRHVYPLTEQLVQMPFFQFFKVDLHCDCPFWPEDGMCKLRDCSVCECEDEEVPEPWRRKDREDRAACMGTEGQGTRESAVDRSMGDLGDQVVLGGAGADRGSAAGRRAGWRGTDNPWMADPAPEHAYTYVNLLKNPERYTGYRGEHARRIWSSIYGHSCFQSGDTCVETSILRRLVSGMHTSITAHICNKYLMDEGKQEWGPNYALFAERLMGPDNRPYLENLYFTYLFVMRAVVKAGPLLRGFAYDTGLPEADHATAELVSELVGHPFVMASCPVPFDEARLWKGENAALKRAELMGTFRNITQIMNCVGCEKCKLWGKLQVLGMGTALKILFSEESCGAGGAGGAGGRGLVEGAEMAMGAGATPALSLERNEIIALLNFLGRLSSSVETLRSMGEELRADPSLASILPVVGEPTIRPKDNLGSVFGL